MNKLSYLKRGKNLLQSVRDQRRWLLTHNKGYIEPEWAHHELKIIDNALGTIVSSDQMHRFLERKETVIRLLIPGRNRKRQNELKELLHEN